MIFPVGVDRPLIRKPIVTLSLIAMNCAVFLLVNPASPLYEPVILHLSSIPGYDSVLTLFTPMFLHGGFWHLFGNMIFFLVPGMKMEDALGHGKFLLFYLACGAAAQAGHSILSGSVPIPSLGASGAIAGVMGGFMILYPVSRIKFYFVYWFMAIIHGVFYIASWLFLGFWFLKEVAFLLVYKGMQVQAEVAFGAHIGGFVAGAIWAWAFYGWNRGPSLDEGDTGKATIPVVVAPTMKQFGGGPQ